MSDNKSHVLFRRRIGGEIICDMKYLYSIAVKVITGVAHGGQESV